MARFCAFCGIELAPSKQGTAKYCSKKCRQNAANERKRKMANIPRRGHPKKQPGERIGQRMVQPADIPQEPHAFADRMEREMDQTLEQTLRHNRARLQAVIDDDATPPTALAKLVEAVVSVTEKLEAITGAGGTSVDLLADDGEDDEVTDELGAAII